MLVYNNILEGYKAREMAEEYNVSEPQAAKEYFEETFEYDDFNEENIKNKKFICNIHNINCDMYYDYGSDYYFLVKENEPMKQQLSLNEKTAKQFFPEFDSYFPLNSTTMALIKKNALVGICEFEIVDDKIVNIIVD